MAIQKPAADVIRQMTVIKNTLAAAIVEMQKFHKEAPNNGYTESLKEPLDAQDTTIETLTTAIKAMLRIK